MNKNFKQQKKEIKKWIKDVPLMFNNLNFITELYNVINWNNQLENFTFEKELIGKDIETINENVNQKIKEIIINCFADEQIYILFNKFMQSLLSYLKKNSINYEIEYDILGDYTKLIKYLRDNYKKNFNDFLIFINKHIYKVQKGFK